MRSHCLPTESAAGPCPAVPSKPGIRLEIQFSSPPFPDGTGVELPVATKDLGRGIRIQARQVGFGIGAVEPLRSNLPKLTSGSVWPSCLEHLGWHFSSLLKVFLVTTFGGKFRQVPANLASAEVDFWRPQFQQRIMKSHVLTSGGPNYHSDSPITTASHHLPQ